MSMGHTLQAVNACKGFTTMLNTKYDNYIYVYCMLMCSVTFDPPKIRKKVYETIYKKGCI